MDNVDAFVAEVLPVLREEVLALHRGDVGPRMALWSHEEPVTLFGAILTQTGWDRIQPAFTWLATTFHGSQSYDYEVLAAGVSGDLGYIAGIEHSVAATRPESDPGPYQLRVTTIFRREHGTWKVVHRHGDPFDPASTSVPPGNRI